MFPPRPCGRRFLRPAPDRPWANTDAVPGASPAVPALCERAARRVGAAALAVLALAGCGGGAELSPLPPGAVILAFGDSLTHGTGAAAGESYPEVLARLTARPVVNAGVPGETTDAGLRRLPGVLEEVRPALVVLCHGGNDILRKQPRDRTSANLREMIRLVRAAGAQVVLVGVPRFSLFLDTAEFYEALADETGVPIESDVLAEVLSDNALKSDQVHPNAAGYARMAAAVKSLLVDRGAL